MNDQNENDLLERELNSWKRDQPQAKDLALLQQRMRNKWDSLENGLNGASRADKSSLKQARWVVPSVLLTTAAAAVVLLAGWLIYPGSVLAQARRAIETAQSVFAVRTHYDDEGNESGVSKIWYDSKLGVREEGQQNDGLFVRIDNGQHQWIYREPTSTLVKGNSVDPVGVIGELLEPLKVLEKHNAEPDASLDEIIDGVACRAYVAAGSEDGRKKYRGVAWLDDQKRFRRLDTFRPIADKWKLVRRAEFKFEMKLDKNHFEANFPGARLVDRTATMQKFVASKAIAEAESENLKIKVRVHQVHRLENDMVLAFWSSSIANSVREKYGELYLGGTDFKRYSRAQWASNGRRLTDHSWREGVHPIPIAGWNYEGVDYEWTVLVHSSRMMTEDKKMSAGFHLHTNNEWEKELKAAGKPWYVSAANDMLELPVPEATESLDEVLAGVYKQIEGLGDGTRPGSPVLNMRLVPWSKERIAQEIENGLPERDAKAMFTQEQGYAFDTTLAQWLVVVREKVADALRDE